MAGDAVPYGGPDGGHDPARLRVSDSEREQVAEILRQAAGEGRLDFAELDERLERAYAARTYAELVPITADLPGVHLASESGSATELPAPEPRRHVAIFSGFNRKGVWTVPAELRLLTLMGGAELDLRHASFAAQEVVITINAFLGGARVIVGPRTRVVMEGVGIMGGYSGPSGLVKAQLDHDSPVVRIRGLAIWGGVSVERKHD